MKQNIDCCLINNRILYIHHFLNYLFLNEYSEKLIGRSLRVKNKKREITNKKKKKEIKFITIPPSWFTITHVDRAYTSISDKRPTRVYREKTFGFDRDNKTGKGLAWERCPVITREIDYPNQIPGRGNGVSIILQWSTMSINDRPDVRGSVTFNNRQHESESTSLSEETNSRIVFVPTFLFFLPFFFSFFFFFVVVTCDATLKTSREYLVHSHGSPIHRTFKMITVVIKLPVGIWCDAQFMANPLGKPRWVL